MSRREEHEAYLQSILSNSLSSENPSKERKNPTKIQQVILWNLKMDY